MHYWTLSSLQSDPHMFSHTHVHTLVHTHVHTHMYTDCYANSAQRLLLSSSLPFPLSPSLPPSLPPFPILSFPLSQSPILYYISFSIQGTRTVQLNILRETASNGIIVVTCSLFYQSPGSNSLDPTALLTPIVNVTMQGGQTTATLTAQIQSNVFLEPTGTFLAFLNKTSLVGGGREPVDLLNVVFYLFVFPVPCPMSHVPCSPLL